MNHEEYMEHEGYELIQEWREENWVGDDNE